MVTTDRCKKTSNTKAKGINVTQQSTKSGLFFVEIRGTGTCEREVRLRMLRKMETNKSSMCKQKYGTRHEQSIVEFHGCLKPNPPVILLIIYLK